MRAAFLQHFYQNPQAFSCCCSRDALSVPRHRGTVHAPCAAQHRPGSPVQGQPWHCTGASVLRGTEDSAEAAPGSSLQPLCITIFTRCAPLQPEKGPARGSGSRCAREGSLGSSAVVSLLVSRTLAGIVRLPGQGARLLQPCRGHEAASPQGARSAPP